VSVGLTLVSAAHVFLTRKLRPDSVCVVSVYFRVQIAVELRRMPKAVWRFCGSPLPRACVLQHEVEIDCLGKGGTTSGCHHVRSSISKPIPPPLVRPRPPRLEPLAATGMSGCLAWRWTPALGSALVRIEFELSRLQFGNQNSLQPSAIRQVYFSLSAYLTGTS